VKIGWKGVLGLVLTAVCLYFAFRNTKWSDALEQARNANLLLLVLSAAAATGMFPLRAIRWRAILDPVAPRLPLGPLWRSIAIGMMVNNIALLRAGEFARVFALTRQVPSVSFSTGFASLIVDRVFDAWLGPESPGCALGVSRNGRVVYEAGYGMANLETGTPITPASIFHVASVSKQFTAMAIMLLARDKKLSIDDDIRKYLPEIRDYGTKITIRHLLTHTSGLRDQWELLALARGRFERVDRNRNVLVRELESLGPLARRCADEADVFGSLPAAHHFGHR